MALCRPVGIANGKNVSVTVGFTQANTYETLIGVKVWMSKTMYSNVTGLEVKQIKLILECINTSIENYEDLDYAWLFSARKSLIGTLEFLKKKKLIKGMDDA